jgi:TrmH family RNA methyltransferase
MFQKITSRDNQKLKNARKVRDGKNTDLIYIEGVRHCEEALRSPLSIKDCFFSEELTGNERGRELIELISNKTRNISELEAALFQTIAETKTSQGIILLIEKPLTTEEAFNLKPESVSVKNQIFIYLSEINNPSNLGAILRTAEAAGVKGVIISENSADVFSPKSSRAALGANLRARVWENAKMERVLHWANERKLVTTAADINSEKTYTEIDWTVPRLLIFGSEAHGLSAEILNKIEEPIYIPMENDVESLNLAVSCGIILFEAKRQIDRHFNRRM